MTSQIISKHSPSKEQAKFGQPKLANQLEGDQSSFDSELFLKSQILVNEVPENQIKQQIQLMKINQAVPQMPQYTNRNNETNLPLHISDFNLKFEAKPVIYQDTYFENGFQSNRTNDQGILVTTRRQEKPWNGQAQLLTDNNEKNPVFLQNKIKEKLDKRSKIAIRNLKIGQTQRITESNCSNVTNLKLITNVKKRMMYFFKNFTSSGRRQYLQNYSVRWMIDDQCDQVDILSLEKFFAIRFLIFIKQRMLQLNFYQKAQNIMSLLNPHSKFSTFLLFFFTFFNSIFFIALSIIIIYDVSSENNSPLYLVGILVFIVEIFIKLNTSFYQGSHLVSDRYMILLHYFKTRAVYDILSTLILLNLPTDKTFRIICQCLSFMKVVNVMENVTHVQQILCMTFKNYYMIQLINLILKILVIGHIIACAYYLIGQIELHLLSYETTWYDEGLSVEHTWLELYLESMYWSLTLLTTGSNVAHTVLQMFFTTFIMLFTTILFGYLMNVTGTIISQFDQQQQNKQLDLNIINQYMRSNNISKELQSQINRDIENYYKSDIENQQKDKSNIFKKISPNLQSLLQIEYSSQILNKVQVINDKFSNELKEELGSFIEEVYFLPNQIIFTENQFSDISLYFIVTGKVELSHTFLKDEKTSKVVQRVGSGSLLGQINFFTGSAYDKTARSNELTKMVRIDRNKFVDAVRKREKDFQVFCEIRDQLMVYENYELVGEKCVFCKNSTHLEQECHLIHIQKDEIYQRIRFYQNKTQDRQAYERKYFQSTQYKSLLIKKQQEVQIKKYRTIYRPSIKNEHNSQDEEGEYEYNFEDEEEDQGKEFEGESDTVTVSINIQDDKQFFSKEYKKQNKSDVSSTSINKKESKLPQQLQYSSIIQEDEKNEEKAIQNIGELKISNNKKSFYSDDQIVQQDPIIVKSNHYFEQPSSMASSAAEDIVININSHTIINNNNITEDSKEFESIKNKQNKKISAIAKGIQNEEENALQQKLISNDYPVLKKITSNDNKGKKISKNIYSKGVISYNSESSFEIQDNKNMTLINQDQNKAPNLSKNRRDRKNSVMQKGIPGRAVGPRERTFCNRKNTSEQTKIFKNNYQQMDQQFGSQSGTNLQLNLQSISEEYQSLTGIKLNNSNLEIALKKELVQFVEDEYEVQESSQNYQSNINEWDFEKLQDFIFYFPKGNSKLILIRYLKNQKKMKMKVTSRKKKLPNEFSGE